MTPNVKSSEKIALVGVVNPQTVANTEVFSGVVDLGAYHQALGIAPGPYTQPTAPAHYRGCYY